MHSTDLTSCFYFFFFLSFAQADIDVMGYSVRTYDWRFTLWVSWNKTSFLPMWNDVVGRELYDHAGDYGDDFDRSTPTSNDWNSTEIHVAISANLTAVLRKQFDGDHHARILK